MLHINLTLPQIFGERTMPHQLTYRGAENTVSEVNNKGKCPNIFK